MRIPKMARQAVITAKVPALNGGVNLCDMPDSIEDNQLSDARNLWWNEGALRTRPGLTVKQDGSGGLPVGNNGDIGHFVTGTPVSEREKLLGLMLPSADGTAGTFTGYSMDLDEGLVCLGKRSDVALGENGVWSGFGVKASKGSDTDYYFFLSDGSILQQGKEPGDGTGRELTDAAPYVPLVMVNGWGNAAAGDSRTPGVLYEGYNMLTGAFRCSYTTDGESDRFHLPMSGLQLDTANDSVEVVITLVNTTTGEPANFPFTITYDGTEMWNSWKGYTTIGAAYLGDNYTEDTDFLCILDPENGLLRFYTYAHMTADAAGILPNMNGTIQNNMVVTVNASTAASRDTICKMTRCVWFGGDRSGVNGGTRLFVCGNPDKPNLVHWSDVNDPLYFPENNYAYIGSGDEAVTGFGKQGDLLVMFKEHEIYAAEYVAGTDYTYEDVISGAVVDVTAAAAQFPITPLHSTIGCDCPDTIRLVNNKLVWATSDAHVYIMPSVNQWSERNVRDITARIRPHLETQEATSLQEAVGGEFKGYYTLFIPDSGVMYLLDAGGSAFQSYAYYASEKKATMLLPWYIWELDSGGEGWVTTVSDGDRLHLLRQSVYMPLYGGQDWMLYALSGDTDDGAAIDCSFTTKLFDFGRMDTRKAISTTYMGLAAAKECAVRVSYITDRDTAQDAYILEGDGGLDRAGRGLGVRRLTPCAHRVHRFGIQVQCTGAMAATGLTIQYRAQGTVR